MKLHIPFLALSLCLLVLSACGTTASSTGTPPADVVIGKDITTTPDVVTPGDVVKTDAPSTGDATTNQCCADKGASCGFVAGCPTSCGGCATGKQCTANKCVDKVVVVKKKFGEACGPDKTCGSYPSGAATGDPAIQTYRDCVNAQCDSNLCFDGYCSQTCVIATDKKNNATGADGADSIEDPGATSDCTGATDGPAGSSMSCTELLSAAQVQAGQSIQYCQAGTNFKLCKADADCPATEACYLKFIGGVYNQMCAPKFKNPNGSVGATASMTCNEDINKGAIAVCQGGFCGGAGCIAFCKTDADCGGWACKKGQDIFGDPTQPTFDVCLPKSCSLDKDCGDPAFYCHLYYNGVNSPDGDPDPTDPTKVKMPGWDSGCVRKTVGGAAAGAACNPFPDSATPSALPTCADTTWCNGGYCGSQCATDAECAANMKCTVEEAPIDLTVPADNKYDAFLPFKSCNPMPAAKGACASSKDCTDAASNYCRPWETTVSLPNATTPSAPITAYTTSGLCIAPEANMKNDGEACGEMAGGALCKSGICLGTTNQTTGAKQPGVCVDLCNGGATCPEKTTIGTTAYKNVCTSYFWAWAGTLTAYDDLYMPLCIPLDAASTLADCAATKKCTAAGEACTPFPIATGPDKAVTIEYRCTLLPTPAPTKAVGAACNPNPAATDPEECAAGLGCEPDAGVDAKGAQLGYCTALCNTNADCGSNDGMICDTNHMRIPRKDASKAGIVPLCLKKKSCLPCTEDFECTGGYKCTAGKCAPPCATDADCAGTDGGAKCVAAKDAKGKDIPGSKVCAATCK